MTREQVIEAVARAMFKAALGADNFEKHDKPTRDYWLLKATAAITAVLDATAEPTEEMQMEAFTAINRAGIRHAGELELYMIAWRAMHAALRRGLTGGG